MKKHIFRYMLILVLVLTACGQASTPPASTSMPAPTATVQLTATPLPSPTLENIAGVTLHQNNPQRTGLYDFPAIRGPVNVLWQAHLSGRIFGAPMFADGLLYVCGFNTVYVFDAQTGEQMEPIRGIGAPFSPLAVAGNLLIGGDANEKLVAYDRNSGKQIWVLDTEGSIYNAPLVIGEVVYAASERGIYALELQTGEIIWQVGTGDHRGFVGHPAYENSTLFVGVGGTYYALDASTGEIRWQVERESDQWFYSSALANGRVYVGSDDGYFYALDQQTGAEVWKSQQVGSGWSAPAIAEGVIYVGNRDQHIYAFDTLTGQEVWQFETVDWAVSDPVISDGVVYVGVGNHENKEGLRPLYAIDAKTGQELWQFEADARLMTGATLGPGVVYIVSVTGTVYALRASGTTMALHRGDAGRTGVYPGLEVRQQPSVAWQIASEPGPAPVVSEEGVYQVTHRGSLYARRLSDGAEIWSFKTQGGIYVSPAESDGEVYIATDGDGAYAVDTVTGEALWHWESNDYLSTAPLIVDDLVYVTGTSGNLVALDARTGTERWTYLDRGEGSLNLAYSAGRIYYAPGNLVAALDAQSGQLIWEREIGTQFMFLAAAEERLYIGNVDGNFYALRADTGETLWTFTVTDGVTLPTGEIAFFWSAPALANDRIYIGAADNHIYALEAQTGEKLWQFAADDLVNDPTVAGGVVYFGTNHHEPCFDPRPVYALDAASGELLWQFETSGCIWGEVLPVENTLLVTTRDGQLYALR